MLTLSPTYTNPDGHITFNADHNGHTRYYTTNHQGRGLYEYTPTTYTFHPITDPADLDLTNPRTRRTHIIHHLLTHDPNYHRWLAAHTLTDNLTNATRYYKHTHQKGN